jgi:hypothetical protein
VDVWLRRGAVVVRALRPGGGTTTWSRGGRRLLARGQTLFTWRVPPSLASRVVRLDVVVRAGGMLARRRYHLRL